MQHVHCNTDDEWFLRCYPELTSTVLSFKQSPAKQSPAKQSPAKHVKASVVNWTVVCIPSHCFLQDFLYMLHLQNVLQSSAVRIFTTGLYKSSSRLHSNVSAFVRTLLETAEVQFWPAS